MKKVITILGLSLLIMLFTFSSQALADVSISQGKGNERDTVDPRPLIPEPATLSLLGLGALGFALARKRRGTK